jgi:hypothetical protein
LELVAGSTVFALTATDKLAVFAAGGVDMGNTAPSGTLTVGTVGGTSGISTTNTAISLVEAGGISITNAINSGTAKTTLTATAGLLALGAQNVSGGGVTLQGVGVTQTGGTVDAGSGTISIDGGGAGVSLGGALTTTNATAAAASITGASTLSLGSTTVGDGGNHHLVAQRRGLTDGGDRRDRRERHQAGRGDHDVFAGQYIHRHDDDQCRHARIVRQRDARHGGGRHDDRCGRDADVQGGVTTADALTINGGTLADSSTGAATATVSGTVTLGADSTINVAGTPPTSLLVISGQVTGGFGFAKQGTGVLVLTNGTNNYTAPRRSTRARLQ